ncbi:LPXTG cell wall anchor domain-containing protein, partial [Ligilactobacillus salivarius]
DKGKATIKYPDKSTDTIPGSDLVRPEKDAEKITPNVPGDKVKVDDPNKLTEDEKSEVVKAVEDANKDENGKSTLPDGTTVTVGDNGDVTVTYPDGSKDTIPGDKVVEGKTTTESENNEPKVPGNKVKVDDPNKLTDSEKSEVVKAVEDANKDENGKSTLPEGSKVTVGDNGDVTVTYPDGSKDTIPGDEVVEGKSDADNTEPKVSGDKVKVDDPNKLTEDEKSEVVKAVEDANKDENGKSTLPDGTTVTVGDNGDVTVTYPDGSKDTIPGDKVVEGKSDAKSDADKNEPKEPGDKVKVDDPNKLTEDEKSEVVKAVEDANKDENGKSTLPEGSKVTVGDNGDVTVTYPDGSKDTIPGDKVVEGKSDAENNEPKVPGDKVKVDDPNKLMEDEKSEVVKAVEDANKDENGKSTLPDGTTVTVGDNGDVTVTYPDGSKDTIPGDKVVEGKTTTESENNEPKVPGDKVKVDDPNKLTEDEKSEVVKAVEDANKDENGKSTLPEGSKVTVGDNGDVTVTYPDGSKDTIPGDKVLEGKSDVKSDAKSDADKNEPKEPGDKVKVDDPNKLTDSEKEELSNNLEKLNPGTVVTIADDGTATLTYPDGSTNTIPGSQLVTAKGNGNTTNSNVKVTPTNTNNKINKDNNSLGKNTANAKAGELPQTGETNDSQKLSVIGMALMGILGLFGLGKKRKKD